jgi:hypothetical protein
MQQGEGPQRGEESPYDYSALPPQCGKADVPIFPFAVGETSDHAGAGLQDDGMGMVALLCLYFFSFLFAVFVIALAVDRIFF